MTTSRISNPVTIPLRHPHVMKIWFTALTCVLWMLNIGCRGEGHLIRLESKVNLPTHFIVIRLSGTDCINCLIAHNQIERIIAENQLDSATVYLLGNVAPNEQDDFFKDILKSPADRKNTINNNVLYKKSSKHFSSSVQLYKDGRIFKEWPFEEFNAQEFKHSLKTLFHVNEKKVIVNGDSTGYFKQHYRDEEYVHFQNNIYAFSNSFGKIYSFQLPTGHAKDSITLDEIVNQLDYKDCIKNAVSDDTASVRLTFDLLNSNNNYFTQNPSYPKFLLTNVSACDSFLCVSLYITYFMKTDESKSYGVNKRAILLLMDSQFNIKKKLYFSRAQMRDYWTFDYQNLHYDVANNIIWKRIFIDSDDPHMIRYTLGTFSDNDGDNIFDLDSMMIPIPELFIKNKLYYNFLSAGFLHTPDTLLYYFHRTPEVYSLDSNVVTTFPQVNMSKLHVDYKNMKFEFPYKAIALGWNTVNSSLVLIHTDLQQNNTVIQWRERPTLFKTTYLPNGKLSGAYIHDNKVVCIWRNEQYRIIKYHQLP